MNTIPDLIPLYDNRPGFCSLLQVEVREVVDGGQNSDVGNQSESSPSPQPSPPGEGEESWDTGL